MIVRQIKEKMKADQIIKNEKNLLLTGIVAERETGKEN